MKEPQFKICVDCGKAFEASGLHHRRIRCDECHNTKIYLKEEKSKKQYPCVMCGKLFVRKYPYQRRRHCDECSVNISNHKRLKNRKFEGSILKYKPTTEQEVVALFLTSFFEKLGFYKVIKLQLKYPDAYVENEKGEIKTIEFEYFSSGYKGHLRNEENKVDYIVCWIKDEDFDNIEIIELKSLVTEKRQ